MDQKKILLEYSNQFQIHKYPDESRDTSLDYSYEMKDWDDSTESTCPPNRVVKVKEYHGHNAKVPYEITRGIQDVVKRSFMPSHGVTEDEMNQFIYRLLLRHTVYVMEGHFLYTQDRVKRDEYRILGFIIAETNCKFDDNGYDVGTIIHLLAVAPEARGLSIASELIRKCCTKYKHDGGILLAVMYPAIMKPLLVDVKTAEYTAKRYLKRRFVKNQVNYFDKYATSSPIYFWVNKFKLLVWDHFVQKVQQHEDMRGCLVLFGDIKTVREAPSRVLNYKECRILNLQVQTCRSLRVVIASEEEKSAGNGIYSLFAQSVLLGWVEMCSFTQPELESAVEKVKKAAPTILAKKFAAVRADLSDE